jgi:methionine-R-sulfoxide reductase
MNTEKIVKTEEQWKKELTPEQYHILREKGTEPAFTGEYTHTTDKGKYVCSACGYELFTSDMKFESHCGWPSFDKEMGIGDRVIKKPDYSFGMIRTEIMCARCGGHLGHIFDDGPTDTGNRYCVNSLSIKFIPEGK